APLRERLAAVRARVLRASAAARAGASPPSRAGPPARPVRVVAVSKGNPVEVLREAYDAGQRHFGENYVKELVEKAPLMPGDTQWHFVGRLECGEAEELVRGCPSLACLETLSSEGLARAVNEEVWGRGGLRRRRAAAERPRRGPGRGGAAVRPGRPRAARPGARGLHDHRGARLQRLPGRGLRDAAPVLRRGGRGTGRGGGLAGAQHGHEQRLRERHPRGLDLCAGGLPAVRAPPRPVQAVRRAATGAARAAEKASSPAPCARRGTGHADSTQSGRLLACFCSSRCCLAPLARPQLALVGLPLVRVVF
ncbi:unnamed protein product, partial [Prorocentrum cordatum]